MGDLYTIDSKNNNHYHKINDGDDGDQQKHN